jgi:DNA primase
MDEELLALLRDKISPYRMRRHEAVFQECPFCRNTKANFEVNLAKQAYHCWVCGNGGGLAQLLFKLQIEYQIRQIPKEEKVVESADKACELPEGCLPINHNLTNVDIVLRYLKSRGIDEADVQRYGIMWWEPQSRIMFPFRNELGNLIFWTARTIYKNARSKYIHADVSKSDKVIIYNGNSEDKSVFLVEGVFDAIRLNKMGKTTIVLLGTEISQKLTEFCRIKDYSVVLCLDNDASKKEWNYEASLKRELGEGKVRAIYLPEKDVAEIGLQGGEGFVGYIKARLHA